MADSKRFSGRQITTMVVALCAAVVAAPIGAIAVTSTVVNIADPAHPAQKAKVNASGRLLTAPCGSRSCAAVDAKALRVGDGGGSLTVDGAVTATVEGAVAITDKGNSISVDDNGRSMSVDDGGGRLTVDGTVGTRALPPVAPWHEASVGALGTRLVAGPVTVAINITNFSFRSTAKDGQTHTAELFSRLVDAAATCTDTPPPVEEDLLFALTVENGQTLVMPFPEPLQAEPVTGKKLCVWVLSVGQYDYSVSGYYAN